MKLSTSTWCDVVSVYEGRDALDKHLEVFFETPFRHFELAFGSVAKPDSMWLAENDLWKNKIEQVMRIAEDHHYDFVDVHSISMDYYKDTDLKRKYWRGLERNLQACVMLGSKQTVVHGIQLWKPEDQTPEKVFEVNRDFYSRLGDLGEKYGVDILAENFQRDIGGFPFRDGQGMRAFVEAAKIPRLHLLWDTGHANIAAPSSQYDDILAMGKELRCLHVHDNWGGVDCHSIPFNGTIDFDALIRGLIEIEYPGPFNLEASDMFIISSENGRGRKRMNREPGDKLADPPLKVITSYLNLLYDTAKWMLDEYGLFEE